MGAFFVYIIQSAVCLLLFYLFYSLLLSKETFHRINRFGLLGLLLLAAVLPFFKVSVPVSPVRTSDPINIPDLPSMEQLQPVIEKDFNWGWFVLLAIYMVGVVFFFLKLVYSYHLLFKVLLKSEKRPQEKSIVLLISDKPVAPFSWMNYIVVSRQDYEENGREILIHEKEHIRLKHSYDLLFLQLYQIVYWFNPVVWLLKRELQIIHEYEADEKVLKTGIDAKKYQLLLIKKAVGSQRFTSMANSFNHSKIKKRITMMLKSKSNPWLRLKYLCVLPLSAAMVAAFAYPEIARAITDVSAVKFSEIIPVAEKSPTEIPVMEQASTNKEHEKHDPVYIVDGKEISGQEFNSLSIEDIERIDVFKGDVAKAKYGEKATNGLVVVTTTANAGVDLEVILPLILIDNKEVSYEEYGDIITNMEDRIEAVFVYESDQPEAKEHGERAKDGLIKITMKK